MAFLRRSGTKNEAHISLYSVASLFNALSIVLLPFFLDPCSTSAPPQAPTGLMASNIIESSVTLRWESNLERVRSYSILYQVNGQTSTSQLKEEPGISGTSYTFRNLRPHTNYTFFVVAVNKAGRSMPSQPVEVSTAELGSPPENVLARAVNATTIVVTWDKPKITNGDIQGYKVFYTESPQKPISLWNQQEVKSDNRMATITGLTPNMNYAISVLAYFSKGQGTMSHPTPVITLQEVPGSPPENVLAHATNDRTVVVTWDEPKITSGDIKGYRVLFTTSTKGFLVYPVFSWKQQEEKSYKRMATIAGLTPNVIYLISVQAYYSIGQGPMSHPTFVVMFQGGSPPENVLARAANATAVVVTWDEPKYANGDIQGYNVFYTESPQKWMFSWHQQNVKRDNRIATITGLTPNVIYTISVTAHSMLDRGPPSPYIQVLTHQEAPGSPPEKVLARAENTTTVVVTWDEPKITNGDIQSYKVFYTNFPKDPIYSWNQQEVKGDKRIATITGLTPNMIYAISVLAYPSIGPGPYSHPTPVITIQEAPGSPPENVLAGAANATTIVVTWDEPKITSGDIQGYRLLYTASPEDPIFFWNQQEVKRDNRIATITGLTPHMIYTISVVVYSSIGEGPLSPFIQVVTHQKAPGSPPENVLARVENTTTVVVTWDEPKITNGDIQGYKVFYTNSPKDPIYSWNQQEVKGDKRMATITGLTPSMIYAISVLAYSSMGPGPYSHPTPVITLQKVPPPPKSVKVRPTSDTTIEVRWDEPDYPVSGYKIFYRTLATPEMNTWQQMDTGPYTVAEITGLEPHAVFIVRVQAKSLDGRYGYPSEVVITHERKVPATTPPGTDTSTIKVSTRLPTTAQTTRSYSADYNATVQTTVAYGTTERTTVTEGPTVQPNSTIETTRLPIRNDFDCHLTHMNVFVPVDLAPNSVLKLKNNSCQLDNNGTHYVTSFSYDQCGTTQEYYYTNLILVKNEITVHVKLASSDPIQFSPDYRIPLICVVRVNNSAVNGAFQAVDRDQYSPQYGQSPDFEMKEYGSASYQDEITRYPVKVPINREIFFELSLTQVRGDHSGIKVDRCEATPTPDANGTVRFSLISDGCSANPAVKVLPSPEPHRYRFSVQTFHFTAPANQDNLVYVHCYLSVCQPTNCASTCPVSKRRRRSLKKRVSAWTLSSGSHLIIPE